MDLSKVFKVLSYVIMVLGGLVILSAIVLVAGIGAVTADAGAINQGGATFFMTLALLPALAVGILSVMTGLAGLRSDPYKCRKYSKFLIGFMAFSAISALRTGSFSVMTFIELAVYGVYCYLAHTQSY